MEIWNTLSMDALVRRPPGDGVTPEQISNLLKKEDVPVEYDEKSMQELKEFCAKYGIVGINVGGRMSPSVALKMLKRKMGIIEPPTSKRGIING